jgi:hypothetical protein
VWSALLGKDEPHSLRLGLIAIQPGPPFRNISDQQLWKIHTVTVSRAVPHGGTAPLLHGVAARSLLDALGVGTVDKTFKVAAIPCSTTSHRTDVSKDALSASASTADHCALTLLVMWDLKSQWSEMTTEFKKLPSDTSSGRHGLTPQPNAA